MLCSNHDYSKIINLPIFIVRDGDLSSSRQWERPPSSGLGIEIYRYISFQ